MKKTSYDLERTPSRYDLECNPDKLQLPYFVIYMYYFLNEKMHYDCFAF